MGGRVARPQAHVFRVFRPVFRCKKRVFRVFRESLKRKKLFFFKITTVHTEHPLFTTEHGPGHTEHRPRGTESQELPQALTIFGYGRCFTTPLSVHSVISTPRCWHAFKCDTDTIARPLARKTSLVMVLSMDVSLFRGRPEPGARSPAGPASSSAFVSHTPRARMCVCRPIS